MADGRKRGEKSGKMEDDYIDEKAIAKLEKLEVEEQLLAVDSLEELMEGDDDSG